jgi:hypothetical protein
MTFGPLSPPIAALRSFTARHRKALGAYVLLGLALAPVPLLGRVHVEASAVVAVVSFFASGTAALASFRGKGEAARSFSRVLAAQEALLLVPLALLTATVAWRPQCDYVRGLLLFLVMPPVTVAFAVSGAYALAGWGVRHARAGLVLGGLAIGIGGPLWDLGLHPQFYTYNHLFGGILGPIYDRELALRPGFFAFRALTLLWAGLLGLVGRWGEARAAKRRRGETVPHPPSPIYPVAAAVVALVIGAAYANAARLGFNTPAGFIQEALGGHLRTAHFDLYYDPGAMSAEKARRLAEDQEWHYHRLRERLGVVPEERIASYLYPDEETKARLTGARETSVSPVWLDRPQMHLLQDAYARSFGHELVHVFSRAFGMPVLNASRAVGLVEGLAVAFEPPKGRPAPADQVSAAALTEADDQTEASLAESVAARLSLGGFWTGRGAVSYTTMGAFVRFLARRYGIEKLRAVYAWAAFEEVYGKSARALAEEWETALMNRRRVALSAGALAAARFSRPSLFEEECPHHVPPHVRADRRGREALAGGDTTAARAAFREALAEQPAFKAVRVRLARLRLGRSSGEDAARTPRERAGRALRLLRAAPGDSAHSPAFRITQADALAMRGRAEAARRHYDRARMRLLPYRHAARSRLYLRRALADRPRLIAALAGADRPPAKARRLRRQAGEGLPPAAAVLEAGLWAESGRYERALRGLRRAPPVARLPSERATEEVRRRRLAWRARWAHRADRPARAERRARRAAQAYRAFGDRDEAARWETFAAKMRWAARAAASGSSR